MRKRKPEPTWAERRAAALCFDQRLRRFAVRKDGRRKLSDPLVEDMLNRFGGHLRSASIPSRIAFIRAARQVAKKRLQITTCAPAFMVTLVPGQFALPYSEALSFDWTEVQRWVVELLSGHDYFGIVEASYYTEHPIPGVREPIVHFHFHAVIWNSSRHELGRLKTVVNDTVPAMLPGRPCMKVDALRSIGRVRRKIAYILKPLTTDYRGFPLKGGPTAGWGQKKRTLRSGEAAKALRLFQGIDVDDLCVAGGEGQAFLKAVARRAKRKLGDVEEGRKRALFELLGSKSEET